MSNSNGMAASHVQPVDGVNDRGADNGALPMTALSDYGSEIDIEDWDEDSLLVAALVPSVEFEAGAQNVDGFTQIDDSDQLPSLAIAKRKTVEVEYHEGSRRRWSGTVSSETPAPPN